MTTTILPEGYAPELNTRETETAIKELKDYFERELADVLNLTRVSAPLFVLRGSGLNDNLNGVERPVAFDLLEQPDKTCEVVQSLAKWKRVALKRYNFAPGEGLYTDMNAIRRDEYTDNLHSLYVDQWDWEKVILKEERTYATLEEIVREIYMVLRNAQRYMARKYQYITCELPKDITFITSQELEDAYPDLSSKERELAAVKKHGAVFISQIGGKLKSGEIHDGRAPDYDDWSMNGDIVFYYPILDCALEVSSMGIRVDEEALKAQCMERGCEERLKKPFCQMILNGDVPYTIGGGIGQSRLCMFILKKAHIGEVQASCWPEQTMEICGKAGIALL